MKLWVLGCLMTSELSPGYEDDSYIRIGQGAFRSDSLCNWLIRLASPTRCI